MRAWVKLPPNAALIVKTRGRRFEVVRMCGARLIDVDEGWNRPRFPWTGSSLVRRVEGIGVVLGEYLGVFEVGTAEEPDVLPLLAEIRRYRAYRIRERAAYAEYLLLPPPTGF